jgi:hypothetical protein
VIDLNRESGMRAENRCTLFLIPLSHFADAAVERPDLAVFKGECGDLGTRRRVKKPLA